MRLSITNAAILSSMLALQADAFSTPRIIMHTTIRNRISSTNNEHMDSSQRRSWQLHVASKPPTKPSLSFPSTGTSTSSSTSTTASSASTISEEGPKLNESDEYQRGLATIAFITLLFSSNSPVLHMAFVNAASPPPVLLLNAATSSIALMGLITFGPSLNSLVPLPKVFEEKEEQSQIQTQLQSQTQSKNIDNIFNFDINFTNLKAGTELGLWKTLGTTANLYGLSLTSANHAAFLIQLTTLIVPAVQGAMGVPIPNRIWYAIGLALLGITMFTQDAISSANGVGDLMGNSVLMGDALCAVAAGFYATYDLRLFDYGKKVPPLPLIRTKIAVQAMLSFGLLAFLGEGGLPGAGEYLQELFSSMTISASSASASASDIINSDGFMVGAAALWSGLAVNAVAPFLQVSGQQAVGASRAQVVYASQPLWASLLSWIMLKETLGQDGMIGGSLFLVAIAIAATAESPDPNCEVKDNCEI
uniref:EamA domain-containing protein n=1 Tax=Chaetoceros debilis TaxID=122233 RepID=A0A7S3V8P1_9STRA|mmetsp:Transcript_22712/g.34663  ORF Transcript_22712/g.34663 Transcript_22712/m.34663 type:complete len:476 (+) Transcript_22712:553-1980(+)|eukprot:CAMPEP_0194075460 /NCGR_PEP_ID=MMETSP0149-20130528/2463_1 /TAXON_ID=122233 /ORGANISM="Chaetoceros debilis, Strain MM31A-1" /LENGTH=475 /DNA_ID=CAMNT_0038755945 /DNA_START=513 /DNA_END=1940 /DNA_ORIENTATION=+